MNGKGSKKQPSAPPGKQRLRQEVHVRADHMSDHIKMGIWSGIAKSLMAPRDSADQMVTTTFFLVVMWSGKTLINEGTGILLP